MRAVRNAISSRRPRIVVADDSTVAREGTAAIIRERTYTLCGLARDQQTTKELLKEHQPDLLLIEPFLGNCDGIFFLKDLVTRFPKTRIVVISRQPEEIYAERALRAGASGYWMKTGTREELIRAIDTVLAGELYVSPRVALHALHEVVASMSGMQHKQEDWLLACCGTLPAIGFIDLRLVFLGLALADKLGLYRRAPFGLC